MKLQPPVPGWKPTTTLEKVIVPSHNGEVPLTIAEIEVPAWKSPDGEIYLDNEATRILEDAKARHMGLLCPDQIRKLRDNLDMTQQELSDLLQIGGRSWSRWENGRERPSRSINVLLCALYDGKIDVHYLRELQDPITRQMRQWQVPKQSARRTFISARKPSSPAHETGTVAA